MRKKVFRIVSGLILTLLLTGVCFAEGGGGGDPAPKDPSCQTVVIDR